ncbi:hypothetical protein AU468_11570 [Alkalispirochaeta sphaeroplastigenens]|uniref:HTH tetR-type domain-containing protein n=1 Tax=Alkalispirochaeta sphaeroplastigenens TaxID=1187066 RepID=A0A2S4JHI7_9SPIO|nr:TetR/AcrR family transcriptional regulator [Alkalispirochaeta sphaeroplastigenens]POQ99018.1 hypothetical protein AU468_11570 [Alkalispirochaeta sphaeroplastigenens]
MEKDRSRTQQAILFASIRLFARHGYGRTSLAAIARAVGIQKPSIYNHYKGKDDILQDIFDFFLSTSQLPSEPEEMLSRRAAHCLHGTPASVTPATALLTELIEWYLHDTDDPLLSDAWIMLLSEQFLNNQAAQIVLQITEQFVEFFRVTFLWMHRQGMLPDISHPEQLGETFGYAIHGFHIEYILRRHHEMPSGEIRARMRSLAVQFGAGVDLVPDPAVS